MVPTPMATKYVISHKPFEKTYTRCGYSILSTIEDLSHSPTGTALRSKGENWTGEGAQQQSRSTNEAPAGFSQKHTEQ